MAEIREKGPNKFLVLVYVGRDAKGKRIIEREIFHGTKKQAEKWAAAWEVDLKRRIGPASLAMTLGEYLVNKWLPAIKGSESVSDRSYETYEYHVRRLKPLIGNLPMFNLTGMALQDALPKGCFGAVAPKTVRGFYGTLKTALKQAVAWGILSVDPTVGLRTPRVPKTKPKVLTIEQLIRLLEAAKVYKHYLVVRLLALTGARMSEILGLRWLDIDFGRGTMTIMRAADLRHRREKEDTKEEASQRIIGLDPESLRLLAAHRDCKVASMTGLVFHEAGRVVSEGAIYRTMQRALKRAGLGHVKVHALRHGAGSLKLDSGDSLAAVAELLGHSSPATTAAVYAHAVRQADCIANLLEQGQTHRSAHQNGENQ